ncbi:MAG: sulfotransferase family protein, partial [Gammaproteobacteria bacterium]
VVGTGRCGTTLLQEMLNLHPELFVFNETHWIPKMFEHVGLGTAPAGELLNIVLRTTHVTGARVIDCDEASLASWFGEGDRMGVAAFCDRLGTMLAARHGKSVWADKTPDYGPYMSLLELLWPACRFVHLIRDGRDVALSMSRHPGYQWLAAAGEAWWVPASFNGYHRAVEVASVEPGRFATLWERRLRRIRDEASRLRPGSLIELRFEALLDRPEETLRTLARFLGLEAPGAWLDRAAARVDRGRLTPRVPPARIEMGERPSCASWGIRCRSASHDRRRGVAAHRWPGVGSVPGRDPVPGLRPQRAAAPAPFPGPPPPARRAAVPHRGQRF